MDDRAIHITDKPNTLCAYARAIISNKPSCLTADKLPHITSEMTGVQINKDKLKAYNKICGYPSFDNVSITFPHILASPLHLQVLSHTRFPLKLLGLVHVRNVIVQHQSLDTHSKYDIQVQVQNSRETDKGTEFDIDTAVTLKGISQWESCSTILARKRSRSDKKPITELDKNPADYITHWNIPNQIGRQYALISGDFNPIHIHSLTARLFGFRRAIAHGMWTLAKSAAELETRFSPSLPRTLNCQFKLPIYLPASVIFTSHQTDKSTQFTVLDKQGEKPHLQGEMINL